MEMATGTESGTRVGNGYAGDAVKFDATSMAPLVETMKDGLKELLPLDDKPASMMLWAAAQLRDYLSGDDVLVPQTVYQLSSNFHRSANFFIETLVIHRKLPSQKLALYCFIPGSIASADKAVLQQVSALRPELTPEYSYAAIALLREPAADDTGKIDPILGSKVHTIGDFVADTQRTRLFVSGFGIKLTSTDLIPFA